MLPTHLVGGDLRLGAWADGVDEFRVGAVRLWSLLPGSALSRVKAERRAAFDAADAAARAEAQRELDGVAAWEPSPADVEAWAPKAPTAAAARKARKAELELRLAQLAKLSEDDYDDAGPTLHVVAFKDAEGGWRAVVHDASDLRGAVAMAPFAKHREMGEFGHGSAVTYCVQIGDLDGGGALSIVADAGSHGTHVAGIVAAHYDDASADGVAPGAQILALKIGDGRLGSAETGTGLVRALVACKRYGVDLINLSYGEPFYDASTKGRVAETFDAAVRKWGMTVFTSAGNDGPALSSLGAPGCLSAPITVGAYVSNAMMKAQYAMLPDDGGRVADTSYTFSSRGPTPDGWLPTLCAPGGAVAPVPRHVLAGRAQYHGTSMSSPNACGVAACVLSALEDRPNPPALRRALENSCVAVPSADPFAQGFGLVDAVGAVAYLEAHAGKPAQDVAFDVTVPSFGGGRGIYLRDAGQIASPAAVGGVVVGVQVRPLFEHARERAAEELEAALAFDLDLDLRCAAPWVETPAKLQLVSGAGVVGARPQSFNVKIDAAGLAPGAHFARVEAFDAADAARGPLFTLPVTAVVPHNGLDDDGRVDYAYAAVLDSGVPDRRFLRAPRNAEYAKVKLRTGALPRGPHAVTFHAVPSARGDLPNTACQTKEYPVLRPNSEETLIVPCQGGATMELCVALGWMSNPVDGVPLDVDVEFYSFGLGEQLATGGATDSGLGLRISAAAEFARLEVGAPLRAMEINPKATLTHVERALRPKSCKITAGDALLDSLPPSDAVLAGDPAAPATLVQDAVLAYAFDVRSADALDASSTLKVVPRAEPLHAQLYDSPLDGAVWRLKDANGRVVDHGGLIHDQAPSPLRAGSYRRRATGALFRANFARRCEEIRPRRTW